MDSKRPPGPYVPSDDDGQGNGVEFRLESSDSSNSDSDT